MLCPQGWRSGSAAGSPRQRGPNPGLPATLLAHLPGAPTRAPRAPPAAPAAPLVRLSSGHHLPLPQDQPMLYLRTPAPPGPWEHFGGNVPHLDGLCLLPATLLVGSVRTVTSRVCGVRRDDEPYQSSLLSAICLSGLCGPRSQTAGRISEVSGPLPPPYRVCKNSNRVIGSVV